MEYRKVKVVKIREDFCELTKDSTAAIVLGQLLYWEERVRDFDRFLEEIQKESPDEESKIKPLHGWIYKTASELAEEILLGCSKDTVHRAIQILIDKELVFRRSNPNQKWDKTYQYRVNVVKIDEELKKLGFNGLSGYVFTPKQFLKNSSSRKQSVNTQNAYSALQNDSAITEKHILNRESFSKEKDSSVFSDKKTLARRTAESEQSEQQSSDTPRSRSSDLCNAIVSYWNDKGLRKHRAGTSVYRQIDSLINKFALGKFQFNNNGYTSYRDHKFKRKDFIKAIDQFALAATDPSFEANEGSKYKLYLKRMSLADFLWNNNAEEKKSLFLHYLSNDAKPLSEKFVKDEHPEITEMLTEEFCNQQPNLNRDELSKRSFVRASNRLKEFYDQNVHKMNSAILPSMKKLGKMLVDSVFENARGKPVKTSYLSSDVTFGEIFPLYLLQQNVLLEKKKKLPSQNYGNPYKPVARTHPVTVYKTSHERGC